MIIGISLSVVVSSRIQLILSVWSGYLKLIRGQIYLQN
jgi:hypothetical protein